MIQVTFNSFSAKRLFKKEHALTEANILGEEGGSLYLRDEYTEAAQKSAHVYTVITDITPKGAYCDKL